MKIIISSISIWILFGLSLSAQEVEFPVGKLYENTAVSKIIKTIPLLHKFSKEHASDTIGIEFSPIQGEKGLEWARYTSVVLNGNEGQDGKGKYSSHQVYRIQPFGPDADDEWEDYLYVVRINSQGKTASAIIQFKCKFSFPAEVGSDSPKLDKLEVVSDKSIIK